MPSCGCATELLRQHQAHGAYQADDEESKSHDDRKFCVVRDDFLGDEPLMDVAKSMVRRPRKSTGVPLIPGIVVEEFCGSGRRQPRLRQLHPELQPDAFRAQEIVERRTTGPGVAPYVYSGSVYLASNGHRKRQVDILALVETLAAYHIIKPWFWIPTVDDTDNPIGALVQAQRLADAVHPAEQAHIEFLAQDHHGNRP